jgi:hypothetical protein
VLSWSYAWKLSRSYAISLFALVRIGAIAQCVEVRGDIATKFDGPRIS